MTRNMFIRLDLCYVNQSKIRSFDCVFFFCEDIRKIYLF